ncbi:hypothetical protein D3C81_2108450 [compost metagenome]
MPGILNAFILNRVGDGALRILLEQVGLAFEAVPDNAGTQVHGRDHIHNAVGYLNAVAPPAVSDCLHRNCHVYRVSF